MQAYSSISEPNDHRQLDGIMGWMGVVSIVAVGVLILWRLLSSCNYGFDFTDEGNYLLWIDTPFPVRNTQFGYIYHPLWALVGKDVALLRQANVLITIGLAFVLSLLLFREACTDVRDAAGPMAKVQLIGIGFGLSTVASAIFFNFFTPSYNSLTFQALLVAATGLIMADRSLSRISIIGWVLLGVGGWLAFMAKPTTAGALAILVLSYVVFTGIARPSLLGLAIGTVVLLLAGFTFAVDGSPMVFVTRLKEAVADLRVLDGGQINWLRIDTLDLTREEWFYQILALASVWLGIMVSATCGLACGRPRWRSAVGLAGKIVWLLLFIAAVAISIAIGFDLTSWRHEGIFRAMPLAGVGLGVMLGSILVWRGRLLEILNQRVWCSVALFLLAPYAFALGTGNNYWLVMSHAGVFWVFAGIVILVRFFDQGGQRFYACLLAVAVAQIISINCIMMSIERPYRQPQPLRQNDDVVNLNPHGSPILLSKGFSDYIGVLRARAVESGYVPGTPVLDLTGHNPGVIFVLGARPVGAAWLLGGYEGSVKRATRTLDRVPTYEIQSAWVLTEPDGPLALPDSLLVRYGLSLEKDYGLVAIFFAPEGGDSSGTMQRLYKPGAVSRVELRSIAEEKFSISLPPQSFASKALEGSKGVTHGWVNVGWRGEVSVQGIEEQPGIMRLVAGVCGQKCDASNPHCLLLQPAVTGDQGIAVVSEAQIVEFECELRSTTQMSSGRLRLRLDARAASGWEYYAGDRWLKIGEQWKSHRVRVRLGNNVQGIRPIIEWHPGAAGDTIELRAPLLRWIKVVNTAPAQRPSDANLRSG